MTPLQVYARRILTRWRLVTVLALIGAAAAGIYSFTGLAPTWTATSALTAQSQDRAPEQDAVLALGYVDYFNQASYQELLGTEISVPAGVELSATTGATSPILYIQATGSNEDEVRAAAAAAAERFQQDVRQSLNAERDQAAADLQKQVDGYVTQLNDPKRTDAEKSVVSDQIRSLQDQITQIQANNTNLLKPLQREPGVSGNARNPALDAVTGAIGGAVLGALVVLLLAVLDRRVGGPADVRQRLDAEPAIELGRKLSAEERTLRTEQLVNRLSLLGSTERTVIAVAGIRAGSTAPVFARQLAAICATRRSGALLVLADLRRKGYDGRMGLVEVLDGWTGLRSTLLRIGGLEVLPPGALGARDPYAVFDPRHVVQFLSDAARAHPVVVIDAPPLLDASESQILCAAADQVLVVAEPGQTSLADARRALELLAEVKAKVGGVALVSPERDPVPLAEPVEQHDQGGPATGPVPIVPPRRVESRRPAGSSRPPTDDTAMAYERTVMLERPMSAGEPRTVVTGRTPEADRSAKTERTPVPEQATRDGRTAKTERTAAAEQATPAERTTRTERSPVPEQSTRGEPASAPGATPGKPAAEPPAPARPLKVPFTRAMGNTVPRPAPAAVPDPRPAEDEKTPDPVPADDDTAPEDVEDRAAAVDDGGASPRPRPRPRPEAVSTKSGD